MKLSDNEIIKGLEGAMSLAKMIKSKVWSIEIYKLEAALDLINRLKAENDDLFYKLTGVMLSVDKWLDGDELKQDEVNRAATMREKTLYIIEKLEKEKDKLMKKLNENTGATPTIKCKDCISKYSCDAVLKEMYKKNAEHCPYIQKKYKVYQITPDKYGYFGSALVAATNAEEANSFILEFKNSDKNNDNDSYAYSYVQECDIKEHLYSDIMGIIDYGIYYVG